jgi:hypothetical protein
MINAYKIVGGISEWKRRTGIPGHTSRWAVSIKSGVIDIAAKLI